MHYYLFDVDYSFVFQWFNKLHPGRMLTVRDLISWVDFFNVTEESLGPEYALLHGAFLVLLDGLSLGMLSLLMICYLFNFSYFLFNYYVE